MGKTSDFRRDAESLVKAACGTVIAENKTKLSDLLGQVPEGLAQSIQKSLKELAMAHLYAPNKVREHCEELSKLLQLTRDCSPILNTENGVAKAVDGIQWSMNAELGVRKSRVR